MQNTNIFLFPGFPFQLKKKSSSWAGNVQTKFILPMNSPNVRKKVFLILWNILFISICSRILITVYMLAKYTLTFKLSKLTQLILPYNLRPLSNRLFLSTSTKVADFTYFIDFVVLASNYYFHIFKHKITLFSCKWSENLQKRTTHSWFWTVVLKPWA